MAVQKKAQKSSPKSSPKATKATVFIVMDRAAAYTTFAHHGEVAIANKTVDFPTRPLGVFQGTVIGKSDDGTLQCIIPGFTPEGFHWEAGATDVYTDRAKAFAYMSAEMPAAKERAAKVLAKIAAKAKEAKEAKEAAKEVKATPKAKVAAKKAAAKAAAEKPLDLKSKKTKKAA